MHLNLLESKLANEEPKTNLRLSSQFMEEGKRMQIKDEIYRIMYDSLKNDSGKLNIMISYLDFKSTLSNLLIDVVTLLILSEKEVRIMFRSQYDSNNNRTRINIHTFRGKVENKIRELYKLIGSAIPCANSNSVKLGDANNFARKEGSEALYSLINFFIEDIYAFSF